MYAKAVWDGSNRGLLIQELGIWKPSGLACPQFGWGIPKGWVGETTWVCLPKGWSEANGRDLLTQMLGRNRRGFAYPRAGRR